MGTLLILVKRWLGKHLFFILAVLLAYFAIKIPQVSHLFGQAPRDRNERYGFMFFVAVLTYLNICGLLVFWKPELTRDSGTGAHRFRQLVRQVLLPGTAGISWLGILAKKCVRVSAMWLGYVLPLAIIAVGVYGLAELKSEWSGLWFLCGGYLRMVSLWLICLGAWLFVGTILGGGYVTSVSDSNSRDEAIRSENVAQIQRRRNVWQTCGQFLSLVAVMSIPGELLWATGDTGVWGFSYRLYSIWAILYISILMVLIAALVDFIHVNTVLPARLFLIFFAMFALWTQGPELVRDPVLPTDHASKTSIAWHDSLEQRVDAIREGPVVLIAASGGGSRAAIFTALILEKMKREKMNLPQLAAYAKTDSDTPINTDLARDRTWMDNVVMISSVSGGSIAAARYLDLLGPELPQSDLRYTSSSDLLTHTQAKLKEWIENMSTLPDDNKSDSLEQQSLQDALIAINRLSFRSAAPNTETDSDTASAGAESRRANSNLPIRSRLFDEMCIDFMAPLLRGFLVPGESRGQGLFHFWNQRFKWQSISSRQTKVEQGIRLGPMLLINTCDIDTGRRVILGFPELPATLPRTNRAKQADAHENSDLSSEKSNEYDPISLASLEATPTCNLGLARAVRMSSNFPFGFHVTELSSASKPQLQRVDKPVQPLRLLDGGVVDNTGLDSLHAVFKALDEEAHANPTGQSARIMRKLRCRGVVILEIDSGAKPIAETGSGRTMFGMFSAPINALNTATYSNARRTGDQFVAQLTEILTENHDARLIEQIITQGHRAVLSGLEIELDRRKLVDAITAVLPLRRYDRTTASVVHHEFVCNHISDADANVMTALALGPEDKAIVVGQYLSQSQSWIRGQPTLESTFANLQKYYVGDEGERTRIAKDEAEKTRVARVLLQSFRALFETLPPRLKAIHENASLDESQKKRQIAEAVTGPYALLYAVRQLVPVSSRDFDAKGSEFNRLAQLLNEWDSGFQTIAATAQDRQELEKQTSAPEPSAPAAPFKNVKAFSKLDEVVLEAERYATRASGRTTPNSDIEKQRSEYRKEIQVNRANLQRESNLQKQYYDQLRSRATAK